MNVIDVNQKKNEVKDICDQCNYQKKKRKKIFSDTYKAIIWKLNMNVINVNTKNKQ